MLKIQIFFALVGFCLSSSLNATKPFYFRDPSFKETVSNWEVKYGDFEDYTNVTSLSVKDIPSIKYLTTYPMKLSKFKKHYNKNCALCKKFDRNSKYFSFMIKIEYLYMLREFLISLDFISGDGQSFMKNLPLVISVSTDGLEKFENSPCPKLMLENLSNEEKESIMLKEGTECILPLYEKKNTAFGKILTKFLKIQGFIVSKGSYDDS